MWLKFQFEAVYGMFYLSLTYRIELLMLAVVSCCADAKIIKKTLKVDANGTSCLREYIPVNVTEMDTLDLIVPGFNITNALCLNYFNGSDIFTSEIVDGNIIRINNISDDMSTDWKCILSLHQQIDCILPVNVRTNKSIEIYTNGMMLQVAPADSSVVEYDAVATYHYLDGEIVETSGNIKNIRDGIRIEYHDAKDNKLFSTDKEIYTTNVKFSSLMRSNKNMSYLDYLILQAEPRNKKIYRIYYIWNQTRHNLLTVWLDGIELFPRPVQPSPKVFEYHTYYIYDQSIKYNCTVKDENWIKEESLLYNGTSFTKLFKNEKKNYSVAVIFKSDLTTKFFQNTRIAGLRADKILYQHTSGSHQWTIHYEYINNETLKMTCITSWDNLVDPGKTNLGWNFSKRSLNESKNLLSNHNILTDHKSLTLSDADNSETLECTRRHHGQTDPQSKVILILHNTSPRRTCTNNKEGEHERTTFSPRLPIIVDVNNAITSVNVTGEDERNTFTDKSNNDDTLVWIIGGTCISAVIMLLVLAYRLRRCYIKRNRSAENSNQCCSGNTLIPLSSAQCNDYVEYNSHYTEIDEGVMVENNYYQTHNNDTNDSEYYADISHQSVGPESGQIGTETLYAQVDKKSKVRNVLGNGRYANTAGIDHYANIGHNIGKEERHYANTSNL